MSLSFDFSLPSSPYFTAYAEGEDLTIATSISNSSYPPLPLEDRLDSLYLHHLSTVCQASYPRASTMSSTVQMGEKNKAEGITLKGGEVVFSPQIFPPMRCWEQRRLLSQMFSQWKKKGRAQRVSPEKKNPSLSTEQIISLLQFQKSFSKEKIAEPLKAFIYNTITTPLNRFLKKNSSPNKDLVHKIGKACDLLPFFPTSRDRSSLWFWISRCLPRVKLQKEHRTTDELLEKLVKVDFLRPLIDQKLNLTTWRNWLDNFPLHPTYLRESLLSIGPLTEGIREILNADISPPMLFFFKLSYLFLVEPSLSSPKNSIHMMVDQLWREEEERFTNHLHQLFALVLSPSSPYSDHFPHLLSILQMGLSVKQGQFYPKVVDVIFHRLPSMHVEQIKQGIQFLITIFFQERSRSIHLNTPEGTAGSHHFVPQPVHLQVVDILPSSPSVGQEVQCPYFLITKLCEYLEKMNSQKSVALLSMIFQIIQTYFFETNFSEEKCMHIIKILCQTVCQTKCKMISNKILEFLFLQISSKKLCSAHCVEISLWLSETPIHSFSPALLKNMAHSLSQIDTHRDRVRILENLYQQANQERGSSTCKKVWKSLFSIFKECWPFHEEISKWLCNHPPSADGVKRMETIQFLCSLHKKDEGRQYEIMEPLFSLLHVTENRKKVLEIAKTAVKRWTTPFYLAKVGIQLCDTLSLQNLSQEELSIIFCVIKQSARKSLTQKDQKQLKDLFFKLYDALSSLDEKTKTEGSTKDFVNHLYSLSSLLSPEASLVSAIQHLLPRFPPLSWQSFDNIIRFIRRAPIDKGQWRYSLVELLCSHRPKDYPLKWLCREVLSILSSCEGWKYDDIALPLSLVENLLIPTGSFSDLQKRLVETILSHAKNPENHCVIIDRLCCHFLKTEGKQALFEDFLLSQISLWPQRYIPLLSSLVFYPSSSFFPTNVMVTMIRNTSKIEKNSLPSYFNNCKILMSSRPIEQQNIAFAEMLSSPDLLPYLLKGYFMLPYMRRNSIFQHITNISYKYLPPPQRMVIIQEVLYEAKRLKNFSEKSKVINTLRCWLRQCKEASQEKREIISLIEREEKEKREREERDEVPIKGLYLGPHKGFI